MRVIGTAGHVDHGKSALVEALTGIHPDRLKEERDREMTIDLGFAWMTLPTEDPTSKEEVGIVDVPGHRDFIENMLAGIGGIDAALFVVAADEGVMPQTREHLAILDLLQIHGGVVALTKIDLVDDPDWLDLVEEDLRQVLANTVLASAPIVRVSARTGEGIPELKAQLAACLSERPHRPDLNRPRLPIDRVFTMSGFGTVVTGTLTDGSLQIGDEVEILPQSLRGRVRGLQTHRQKVQSAVPGSRTAVNITGISVDQMRRGDVLAHPGTYRPSRRLDVRFRLLPGISAPIKHNMEVKLFIHTIETMARLRLLGSDEIAPGGGGWAQLELRQPIVAVRGDRYILRRPSPSETLGGGAVVDPHPKRRHKRFSAETLASLEALDKGTPVDILLEALLALGVAPQKDVILRSNLDPDQAKQALIELERSGLLINLEQDLQTTPSSTSAEDLITSKGYWDQMEARVIREITYYHSNYPLRSGMPREELKSRIKDFSYGSARLFNAIVRRLVNCNLIQESGTVVHLPDHAIRFTPQQQAKIEKLTSRFAMSPFSPPSLKECQAEVGEDVFAALVELGDFIIIPPDVVFRKQDYQAMVMQVRDMLQRRGAATVAEVRDHFNTSRKYALALLEHLDSIGVTVREGDIRKLKG